MRSSRHSIEYNAAFDLVHGNPLRCFPDLVRQLGGDPAALVRAAGISSLALSTDQARLGYRSLADLLERAATQLQCPDFGMRLALHQGTRGFGLMGVVMKNSNTFGDAVEYAVNHAYVHSLAASICFDRDRTARGLFVAHDLLLDHLPNQRQVIEQVLLLGHLNAVATTGGRARVREVHFRYQPLSPLRTYHQYFGCEVRFNQKRDGVAFSEHDLRTPIVQPDTELYAMATSFIESSFASVKRPMHARARAVILQLIGTRDCVKERVAAELCVHPRTLHRRLSAEGQSYEQIKDEVRRDMALNYLQQTDLPFPWIAEKLGYAEHSVFTRSCVRWFSMSPRQLRLLRPSNARPQSPLRAATICGCRVRVNLTE
jgi:AraC-like DNA-binding protein